MKKEGGETEDGASAGFVDTENTFGRRVVRDEGGDGGVVSVGGSGEDLFGVDGGRNKDVLGGGFAGDFLGVEVIHVEVVK